MYIHRYGTLQFVCTFVKNWAAVSDRKKVLPGNDREATAATGLDNLLSFALGKEKCLILQWPFCQRRGKMLN